MAARVQNHGERMALCRSVRGFCGLRGKKLTTRPIGRETRGRAASSVYTSPAGHGKDGRRAAPTRDGFTLHRRPAPENSKSLQRQPNSLSARKPSAHGRKSAQRQGELRTGGALGESAAHSARWRPQAASTRYGVSGIGSGGRDRTYDQLINSQLLYR